MSETLALLPGWGLGPAALAPLATALRAARPQAIVTVHSLPQSADPEQALAELDQAIPPGAWLLGWSLGGMLAVKLAERRARTCPGVITFASNGCFVARDGWPAAMASETFKAFSAHCTADPAGTLKRFGLLCIQGSQRGRALLKGLNLDTTYATAQGLALLAALDNRAALQAISQPQLHVYATADALVPTSAASAAERIALAACIETFEGSHALVLEAPDVLASRAWAFIEEATYE
ncbi:alpha/beta fold hydrolase [Pseudomonas japonica]|uniref:alpha/beta fold hydrolase n=1 Tax=Pseudomonas japonica TaxID=256466 RepID=UPI0015E38C4D|nr:alpha/beta fold hydrolase [Pseudomonas japonica]MBA1287550.1 alpha/beta fold hydrolase [Pseudomonas japonica]